jgi:hypothetical protein
MSTRSSLLDLEWWAVPKRLIYIVITLLILGVLAGGVGLYIWVYGNPFKGAPTETSSSAGARFDSFEGDVRVVRASTRETIQARSDTRLMPGDTVQTQQDGRARISLADGSTLIVKPNSVVTIAENTTSAGGRTNVRVAVDRGQMSVRTDQQPEGASNIVKTPLTENHLSGQTGATFGVSEDKSEDIRVSSGSVVTSTRNGDKTTLNNGEYVAINASGSITQREKLLDVPTPSTPRNLEKLVTRKGGATSASLRWQRPNSGTPAHYRVEVATSPFFVTAGKVIERDQLEATEFTVGDLRQGNYFWRVRAIAASGQASDWSEPQKFLVVAEGGTGDRISVSNVSFEYVAGNIHIMRGRTQPGTTIRCSGRETLSGSDGSFQLQITAPRETREINVEAEDAQGNRDSYRIPFSRDAGQR